MSKTTIISYNKYPINHREAKDWVMGKQTGRKGTPFGLSRWKLNKTKKLKSSLAFNLKKKKNSFIFSKFPSLYSQNAASQGQWGGKGSSAVFKISLCSSYPSLTNLVCLRGNDRWLESYETGEVLSLSRYFLHNLMTAYGFSPLILYSPLFSFSFTPLLHLLYSHNCLFWRYNRVAWLWSSHLVVHISFVLSASHFGDLKIISNARANPLTHITTPIGYKQ